MHSHTSALRGQVVQRTALYFGVIAAAAGGFAWLCHVGGARVESTAAPLRAAPASAGLNSLAQLLFALAIVIATSQLLGALFRRLGSPPVIGEILAGIVLGPSLLGRVAPQWFAQLFPPTVAPGLSVLAQIGVLLYMFLVGLEVDFALIARRGHAAVAISHASIVVPFVLGGLLAYWLHPILSSPSVPFTHFALFCGVAMSVTAFPVLARILTDRREQHSRLGMLALTCAAVDDVTAWCLLGLVISVIGGDPSRSVWTLGLTVAFIAVLVLARPWIERWVERHDRYGGALDKQVVTKVALGVLASALVSETIGIHALFGAFAAGVVIPARSRLAESAASALTDFIVVVFLPAFFAYTGLRTQIGLVSTGAEWLLALAVLATACAGKFGGTLIAARFVGMGWRDSAALGVLMNTRGLMELIVLNIGLDLQVISPTLFAMMVIMALVTTFATTPALQLLSYFDRRSNRNAAGADTIQSALEH